MQTPKSAIAVITTLSILLLAGCKNTTLVEKTSFTGALSQPTSAIYIEIGEISNFKYVTNTVTGPNASSTLTEESTTRLNDGFVKEGKSFLSGKHVVSVKANILPNGMITKAEFNDLTKNTGWEDASDLFGAASRFPDYALGLKIHPGFKSKCWREEAVFEVMLTRMFAKNPSYSESDFLLKSDSTCTFSGITTINQRKAAVFQEYIHTTISKKGGGKIGDALGSGWRAIDLEKGVNISSHHNVILKANGMPTNLKISMKIDMLSIE